MAPKGKKKQLEFFTAEDDDDFASPAAAPAAASATNGGDDSDDAFASQPANSKKAKKAAQKKTQQAATPEPEPAPAPAPAPAAAQDDDSDDDGAPAGGGMLSKADKKKKKKAAQKEKAKTAPAAAPAAPAAAAPEPEPEAEAAGSDDEDAGAGGAGGKNKKKKKKKAGAKEEPAPKLPAGAKVPAGIAAMRAALEAKRLAEEEARRREEEERRRIEEEERRAAEEERLREEAKQRKKEREKEKREIAKKEGRLLTKKQKEERAAAEIRRKALLDSGVIIEGLQQGGAGASKPKKVSYGSKKKKPTAATSVADTASVAAETPEPLEEEPAPSPAAPADDKDSDDGDAWDASDSDDEDAKAAKSPEPEPPTPAADEDESMDDWEKDSDDDAPPSKPAPAKSNGKAAPAAKPASPAPPKGKAAPPAHAEKAQPPAKAAPPARPAAGKKAAPPPAESSDDDSSEEDDSSDEDSSSDDDQTAAQKRLAEKKAEMAKRKAQRLAEAKASASKEDLRSPICCILGHVDTGKTKLLDKIRQTNVQEGEAGGITQQIGATYFPVDAIRQKTAVINKDGAQEYKIPGLLVIDTPGHESFTNLRSRGSSLCNIAILVVDIMHGLEPQTLESLRLLRDKKTPFIVALNKIDRLFGWEATPDNAFRDSLAKQKPSVKREFETRTQGVITEFAEQGLNAVLYYENKSFARNVSLVPTSAITGEGVPDMIMLLVNLTQQRMSDRLMYLSELECTVLEVKVIEGLGTTIDVVLSNGILREGDRIVVCGLNGPIVTQVRALLTPQPLRELRVKSAYVHHKEIKAAMGVKISAPDLEKAIAGSQLLVVGPDDDEEVLRDAVMTDLTTLVNSVDKSERGVCVQASTLGSLEALLDFLKVSKIPVSGIGIGPVHKKDIMRAATMVEKAKELAVILCFDVTVDREVEKLAEEMGVRLFKADIIYHLFDAFTAYNNEITEAKRKDAAPQAIWPCRLRILRAFAKRDPIILGVDILDGTLRVGTPLCVVKKDPQTGKTDIVHLGKITSLEINHKTMDVVKKSQQGAGVAVKIEHAVYETSKMFGRHFDEHDEIISHITRTSIDVLKSTFKADVTTEEWLLIKALKPKLGIP